MRLMLLMLKKISFCEKSQVVVERCDEIVLPHGADDDEPPSPERRRGFGVQRVIR